MKKERTIPVIKNEYYTMLIEDLGSNGEGIGKIEGYTLFVQGALPGERVEVRVVKTKKNFGFGRLMKILLPSINRLDTKCSVANRCGGCQLQHLSYEAQLKYKRKKVADLLERIGGLNNIKINPTIGMEEPYYYRNKVQLPVGIDSNGDIEIGFYAARSHNIITTKKCYIQQPINELISSEIKTYMIKNKILPYDEHKHKGLVRHIVTRISRHTKEIMVGIVINGNILPNKEKIIDRLIKIPNVASIFISINKEKTNVILGKKISVIWGKAHIIDVIGDTKFHISPESFYQVNSVQTEKLYKKVLEYANLTGEEIVWDIYCGIGTISLFLAKVARRVYAVDIVPKAIEDAKRNAIINKAENVEFHVGNAEIVIPKKYKEEGIRADVIIVDPPRKGCAGELLDTMIKMEPSRIIYVSCDPATLARDLKVLVEGGYEVVEVQPVDMFPHTVHVETVVRLRRVNP